MLDVNFNMSNKNEGNFKCDTMDDFNGHEIGGMHGNNINDIFRDVNNNLHKLNQGEQNLMIHIHLLTKRSLMLSLELEAMLFSLNFDKRRILGTFEF
jgi:hypothetical protein